MAYRELPSDATAKSTTVAQALDKFQRGDEYIKKKTQDLQRELQKLSANDFDTKEQQRVYDELQLLQNLRGGLVSFLPTLVQNTAQTVSSSRAALANQMTVAEIMNQQVQQAEIGLGKVAGTQNNKMRMVEVNTYYSDRYRAQAGLMKLIIIVCVAFLLIVILMKKNLIPQPIAITLLVGVVLIGGFLVALRHFNISSRSSMVFDEFDWNANPPAYEPGSGDGLGGDFGIPCVDSECCIEGETEIALDEKGFNKCVPIGTGDAGSGMFGAAFGE